MAPSLGDWAAQHGFGRSRQSNTAPVAPFSAVQPFRPTREGEQPAKYAAAARTWFARQQPDGRPPVIGHGDDNARVVIMGKAPGEAECRAGAAFVGPSGDLLSHGLANRGLAARPGGGVWLTNASFWFAEAGAEPSSESVLAGLPVHAALLDLLNPDIIIACGRLAGHTATGSNNSVARLRQQLQFASIELAPWSERRKRAVHVTWHPAYVLREPRAAANFQHDLGAAVATLGPLLQPPPRSQE